MAITVILPHDPLWTALDWAKKHCPSYITNDVYMSEDGRYDSTKIVYYFSQGKDATLFALRWL